MIKIDSLHKLLGTKVVIHTPLRPNYDYAELEESWTIGVLCFVKAYYKDNKKELHSCEVTLDNGFTVNIDRNLIDIIQIYPATELGKVIYGD